MNKEEWEKINKDAIESIKKRNAEILEREEWQNDKDMAELLNRTLQLALDEIEKDNALKPHIEKEMKKGKNDPELLNYTVYDYLELQNEERAANASKDSKDPYVIPAAKSRAVILLERARESLKAENEYKDALRPYVLEEIKALKNNAAYGLSIDDILALYSKCEGSAARIEEEIQAGNVAAPVLKKAINAKKKAEKQARAAEAREAHKNALKELRENNDISSLPVIHYAKKDPIIALPTDVFAKQAFEFEKDNKTGAIIEENGRIFARAFVDSEKTVYWKISTTQEFRKLDLRGYDFFLACVLDKIYSDGRKEASLSMILNYLHLPRNNNNKQKLLEHLKLGSSVSVDIDNSQIVKKWGKDPNGKRITGQVFFVQIDEQVRIIDGNISNVTVRIGGYSPFYRHGITFLGQRQEWDEKMLEKYTGTRNESYWRILRYLIQEVGYMIHGGRNTRLLMSSIYDYVGVAINDRNKQKRIRETTQQILKECFAGCGYITLNAFNKDGKPDLEIDKDTNDIFVCLAKEKRIKSKSQ